MKNKLKTTILTTLLFVPILFIGNGFNNSINNNTQINNITSRDNHIENNMDYGDVSQFRTSKTGTFGFVSHKDGLDHLYTWGRNDNGQVGNGAEVAYDASNPIPTLVTTPTDITGGKMNEDPNNPVLNKALNHREKITQFSMGNWHSGAVVEQTSRTGIVKDHLYMWGSNHEYQNGDLNVNNTNDVPTPFEVTAQPDFKLPLGAKITELNLHDHTSEVTIEAPVSLDNKLGWKMKRSHYEWGGEVGETQSIKPKKTDPDTFFNFDKPLTPPLTPPTYVTTKANTLPYIIAGSVLGLLLLIAIIVSGIFYGKYKNEKTRKQLI